MTIFMHGDNLENLNISTDDGVIRISMVHYNSEKMLII